MAAINLTKLDNLSGVPLLTVLWCDDRDNIPPGFGPADGQLLPRSVFPDAFTRISNSPKRVVSDAAWLADPLKRGKYTLGDGSTTFRVPDLNGKQADSIGALYLRGDGKNAGTNPGDLQGDIQRKITGKFGNCQLFPTVEYSGAFEASFVSQSNGLTPAPSNTGIGTTNFNFDSSKVVPTGPENRPVSATGCFIIKLFGAVIGEAQANIAQLATDFAAMASRVSVLEQRKSTCLVNAIGTGAPHETVVSQLPANIAINTRYVLPNPFGVNTPVECWAEVFTNGKWAKPGWAYAGPSAVYGVAAGYVQGEGVIVQTGKNYILARSIDAGGLSGGTTAVTSAPCRVFVRKLE